MNWKKVYDLADDIRLVTQVQKATLETEDYGLVPEIALYGTQEWWAAIADGRIERMQIEGRISRVYMSGHNDWPEFEVECNGEKTRWTRCGDDSQYKVGRRVRIEYVWQKAKKAWVGSNKQKEVLQIFIES
jgi:hypothetical protein